MTYGYTWPILQTFHFVGLVLLLGTIGILDLRVLGMAKRLPVGPLHQLVPWGIAGFCISATSGILFFIGHPSQFAFDTLFRLKLATIFLAGVNVLIFYLTVFREVNALGPGEDAPPRAKVIALMSLVLWFAVICLGRYMALT
jgi:hypothetical protein